MHEPYDDDDEYDEDYYNHDHPFSYPDKWYFKFDVTSDTSLSSWINDMLNTMNLWSNEPVPNWPTIKIPVSSYFPNTGKNKNSYQYLGNNYYNEGVFKYKYFIVNEINIEYYNHLKQHASYFLQQPEYYKGLFDILN